MKAKQLITLVFLMCSITFYSQGAKKEKIKALKIAYITKDLSLTSSIAEKFWPIYNSYDEKQFELRMIKMRKIRKDLDQKPLESLSDSEANVLLAQIENLEDETYQNRKKLITDLRKIITPLQILKLKKAEDDFNKSLLKQFRQRN